MSPAADGGKRVTICRNPFPGLRPFNEQEEHLFFGRDSQVDAMVDKLAANHFLAVVGTSGSGKSSLVNCGLRPALHGGLMGSAGTAWRMAQFRPGSDPLRAMADALAVDGVLFRNYQSRGLTLAEIVDTTLRMSKLGLIDIYEQAQLRKDDNLLVVVDQFEELFRYQQLGADKQASSYGMSESATAFVNLLLEAMSQKRHPIYVVLTMRSDFLGDCAQFRGLAEAINGGQYLVPRLTREERRAAISGPVGVGGAEISPVLLTRLINDVGDNPDQLSILQHALNRTWAGWQNEGRGQGPLNLTHYEAIGTMANALDKHAEKAYEELTTARQKQICEKIFKALTDKATDPRGVRRPTTLGKLCALNKATTEEVANVIDVFRQPSRSFLMPPAGESLHTDTPIDISHESLMRVWKRLNVWADEEADSARTYRRLVETAALHGAGKAGLLRGPDLQMALDWRAAQQPTPAWASFYKGRFETAIGFLRESKTTRDQDEAERVGGRKIRRTGQFGFLFVALAVILGFWYQRVQVAEAEQRDVEYEQEEQQRAEDALTKIYEIYKKGNPADDVKLQELSYDLQYVNRYYDLYFELPKFPEKLGEKDRLLFEVYRSVKDYRDAINQDQGNQWLTQDYDSVAVQARIAPLKPALVALKDLTDNHTDSTQAVLARGKLEPILKPYAKRALRKIFKHYEKYESGLEFDDEKAPEEVKRLLQDLSDYNTSHHGVASQLPPYPAVLSYDFSDSSGADRLLALTYGCFADGTTPADALEKLEKDHRGSIQYQLAREAVETESGARHQLTIWLVLLTIMALPVWFVMQLAWMRWAAKKGKPAEAVSTSLEPEPFRRAGAGVIDLAFAYFISFLAALPVAVMELGFRPVFLTFTSVACIYLLLRDASTFGFHLSVGKRICGLRAVNLDGQPATIRSTLKRNGILFLAAVIGWSLIQVDSEDLDSDILGYDIVPDGTIALFGCILFILFLFVAFLLIFRKESRTVGDWLASTKVINVRTGDQDRAIADPFRRAAAGVADLFIAMIAGVFFGYVAFVSAAFLAVLVSGKTSEDASYFSAVLVFFLVAPAYLLFRDAIVYRCHRSIGKIMCGIVPVTLDGGPVTMKVSAKRNWILLAEFILCVFPCIYFGAFLVLVLECIFYRYTDKDGRNVRDRLGKTKVINVRSYAQMEEDDWGLTAKAVNEPLLGDVAGNTSEASLAVASAN